MDEETYSLNQPRTIERHVFIEFGHGVAQRTREGGWIDSAAHEERHGRNGELLMWNVNLQAAPLREGLSGEDRATTPTISRIGGSPGVTEPLGLIRFPSAFSPAKIFVHEALRDDSDRRRVDVVAFSEVAAAQRRHAQCFEEIGRDEH